MKIFSENQFSGKTYFIQLFPVIVSLRSSISTMIFFCSSMYFSISDCLLFAISVFFLACGETMVTNYRVNLSYTINFDLGCG